jgi:hypothetical protein
MQIKASRPLTVKLAPPIVLVTPSIARPRALLDELVAIHTIPPLLVVRKRDRVLHVLLAPVESVRRTSLDDEPFLVLRSGDLDVVRVGAVPVAHGVAGVVDDVDVPLGGGVGDFEAVGSWGFFVRIAWLLLGWLRTGDLLSR